MALREAVLRQVHGRFLSFVSFSGEEFISCALVLPVVSLWCCVSEAWSFDIETRYLDFEAQFFDFEDKAFDFETQSMGKSGFNRSRSKINAT